MQSMTVSSFEFVRDNMARTPYHKWLLPELVTVNDEEGSVTVRLVIRPELGNSEERTDLHGGVVSALVDIAGHAAVAAKVRHSVPTVDMRVDYLRPAGGKEITAFAKIVKFGRMLSLVDIRLTDDQNKVVAVGRATYVSS
jgi:uncharacterized protein (TIGR00369 family)